MKKQIIAMLTCLMMCSVFMFSSFVVDAAVGQGEYGLDFYVPYSKPEGDGMGYLSLVCERNGQYRLETFIWNIQPYDVLSENDVQFANGQAWFTINDSEVSILIQNTSQNAMVTANLFLLFYSDATGVERMNFVKSGVLGHRGSGTEDLSYTLDYKDYDFRIVGYEVGGNAYAIDGTNAETSSGIFLCPTIHWNQEVGYEVFQDIMYYLARISVETDHLNKIALTSSATRQAIEEIRDSLKLQLDSIEQEKMDKFSSSSSSQTDDLNSLNQQTQVDKIDIESTSQTIDDNLNVSTDANYGVLLSTITGNSNILTMLLVSVSVALISFVFFGKR